MLERLQHCLKTTWGYDGFLPLQREAMACALEGRDSLVVLPTGGGKSLCFQAPALALPGMAVVVSPLISLMKDQVEALLECGVAAARLDSTLSESERREVYRQARSGELKLLYVSPERLLMDGFLPWLREQTPSLVAIDEAHCVSMWGHDFRPEYRRLGVLKQALPGVALHAFTATATELVRRDIVEQLGLDNPEVLVGSFDRPNLIYRARPRGPGNKQIIDTVRRHPNESGIIYCIRRADVDALCAELRGQGIRAVAYHAGLSDDDRKNNQDAFVREDADVVVATVAFGMGIDKSNVRYVIHAAMPKSIEHYQQESGRGGRDGLEAECWLFYTGADFGIWRSIISGSEPASRDSGLAKLGDMYSYCTAADCRHRRLSNYFGQDLPTPCGACDVCLDEVAGIADALVTAQKIVSCVARLSQSFGAAYTAQVLAGSREERIVSLGHDRLSTYGLLAEAGQRGVRDWIEQLVGQGVLAKSGPFNVLTIAPDGLRVLRGELTPKLLEPRVGASRERKAQRVRAPKAAAGAAAPADAWKGVDRELFGRLRDLRKQLADTKRVPAYVVFSDASLRDMARRRPATGEEFLECHGVGEKKLRQYGKAFLEAIGGA